MFTALTKFAAEHGHTRVPKNYIISGRWNLSNWVTVQHRGFRRKTLAADRVSLLEALPGWSWKMPSSLGPRPTWDDMFEAFSQVITENGGPDNQHRNGPMHQALSSWIYNQRKASKAGKLKPDRADRLSALLGEAWADLQQESWDTMCAALRHFAAENGHVRVPEDYVTGGGRRLGDWISHQRKFYRERRLDPQRAARLEAVPGWAWSPSFADRWDANFLALQRFSTVSGHVRVPAGYASESRQDLRGWVSDQRAFHRERRLEPRRAARLEALPGWTWGEEGPKDRRAIREQYLTALRHFVADSGHGRVPQDFVTSDGLRLGDWVSKQRCRHSKDMLDPDLVARLDAVPGWVWSVKFADSWDAHFIALQQFVADNGHARAPQKFATTDGLRLGAWVSSQRHRHSKDMLDADRAARLEALPGWAWSMSRTLTDRWDASLFALQHFTAGNGHARVPQGYVTSDGQRLGAWVETQRHRHTKGMLEPDRVARLEAVPGWVWSVSFADKWDASLSALQQFVAGNGHARVPQGYVTSDGRRLGAWVMTQRRQRVLKKLDPQRVAKLEQVPGWFWSNRDSKK